MLRGGKLTLDQCRFPGDEAEDSFHLGYFDNEQLVCIATFHLQNYGQYFQVKDTSCAAWLRYWHSPRKGYR